MKRIALLLFILIAVPILNIYAQDANAPQDIISSGINLTTDPAYPGPNASVNATLDSSTLDLDTSRITWGLNGKQVQSGIGARSISFVTSSSGDTTISVTIDSSNGTYNKTFTVGSGSVDLLWQGGGYTPPFYEGRTMWGYQNRLTFMAIPHISGNSSLIYRWTLNNNVASTGVGKNNFIISDSILGIPQNVTVDVIDDQGNTLATNSVTLSAVEPKLLVYEDNPLTGIRFENEVGDTYILPSKEVTLSAFPYFFSGTRDANNISSSWIMNAGDTQNGFSVTYRAPDTGTGQANITVETKNLNQILQNETKNFLIQFGQ